MTNLRAQALELLNANPLLSVEQRKKWKDLLSRMNAKHLRKFISVLEESKKKLINMVAKKVEQDKDGTIIKEFNKREKVLYRNFARTCEKKDSESAERELEDSINNL